MKSQLGMICLLFLCNFNTIYAENNAAAITAFENIDQSFMHQYDKGAVVLGQSTYPRLMVQGFHYRLLKSDGTVESFDGMRPPFKELKAVSHLDAYLFSIGNLAWQHPNSTAWKSALIQCQSEVQAALKVVKQVDWSNPAWPGKGQELAAFMQNSLVLVNNFIQQVLTTGKFTKQDYSEFASHYVHTMVATMYLASLGNTFYVLNQLKTWKKQLGKQWDDLYVVILGTKGRPTAELSIENSTVAVTVGSLMKPSLVESHVVIAATDFMEAAVKSLGTILQTRQLSTAIFTNDRMKKVGGLHTLAASSTKPLALQDVKNIIQQLFAGKLKLPIFDVLDKDKNAYTQSHEGLKKGN